MIALILLLLPLVIGLVAFLAPGRAAYLLCTVGSAASMLLAGFAVYAFINASVHPDLFQFAQPWLPAAGISFSLGLDGISLLLVFLCNLLVFLISLGTAKHPYQKPNVFYGLMLLMQAGMLGVFMARDGFLFYVAWECALIPIYFICSLYGGLNRIRVSMKFFIYTLLGSLFMLAALIYLYLQTPDHSFSLNSFYNLNLDMGSQTLVFLAFYLAFAIKMPIFPLHTWQPDTYTEAPAEGSMLLSGIMLKMGIFGFLRWVLPVVPAASTRYAWIVIGLGVFGIIYFSIIAFRQKDMKRLLAYSSLAHVALIGAAVFAANGSSLQGAVVQMFSHGINIAGLFFVVSIIEKQTGSRSLSSLGGLASGAPVLAICFGILVLGSVALPLTNGFPGEFLMLGGLFRLAPWVAALSGLTIIFGAVYMFRMYQKAMLGPLELPASAAAGFQDVSGTDKLVLIVFASLVILTGIWPAPLFRLTEPTVRDLLLQLGQFHQHIQ